MPQRCLDCNKVTLPDEFTLNIEQIMSIHEQGCDAYRAGINENPYKHKLKSKCWREGWESIMAFEAYCVINYK